MRMMYTMPPGEYDRSICAAAAMRSVAIVTDASCNDSSDGISRPEDEYEEDEQRAERGDAVHGAQHDDELIA